MDRRNFLRKRGLGAAVAATAPVVIPAMAKPKANVSDQIAEGFQLGAKEREEFMREWRKYNGVVVCKDPATLEYIEAFANYQTERAEKITKFIRANEWE